jgi:hypothetical protein
MKKIEFKSPRDKVEFVIYILNIVLILLFMVVILGFLGLLGFYLFYGLTNVVFQCIISIGICSILLYNSIKYAKFKEIRSKFNNQIFEKKAKKKENV